MTTTLLFLAHAIIAFQGPKPTRNAWAGAADGSWVVIEMTETAGE